ncbi:MAG: ArsR/SmtB family transcription factor [Rhodospirillaceae bacterium]
MEIYKAVAAFSALAHEGRLSIYRLLVEAGTEGLPVADIAAELGMPGPTLSFHLSQLQRAGLIRANRQGRRLIQTADFGQMNELIGYLTENCCGGQSCAPVCKPAKPTKGTAKRRTMRVSA